MVIKDGFFMRDRDFVIRGFCEAKVLHGRIKGTSNRLYRRELNSHQEERYSPTGKAGPFDALELTLKAEAVGVLSAGQLHTR